MVSLWQRSAPREKIYPDADANDNDDDDDDDDDDDGDDDDDDDDDDDIMSELRSVSIMSQKNDLFKGFCRFPVSRHFTNPVTPPQLPHSKDFVVFPVSRHKVWKVRR